MLTTRAFVRWEGLTLHEQVHRHASIPSDKRSICPRPAYRCTIDSPWRAKLSTNAHLMSDRRKPTRCPGPSTRPTLRSRPPPTSCAARASPSFATPPTSHLTPNVPLTEHPFASYSSQVSGPRSDRSSASKWTLPASDPDHRIRSGPHTGCPERTNQRQGRCPGPNRLRRARKHKEKSFHDVPKHHDVRCRTFQLHAPDASSRVRCQCHHAAVLPHQRLPDLPRGRHRSRDRDLPDLRSKPAAPLSGRTQRPERRHATAGPTQRRAPRNSGRHGTAGATFRP